MRPLFLLSKPRLLLLLSLLLTIEWACPAFCVVAAAAKGRSGRDRSLPGFGSSLSLCSGTTKGSCCFREEVTAAALPQGTKSSLHPLHRERERRERGERRRERASLPRETRLCAVQIPYIGNKEYVSKYSTGQYYNVTRFDLNWFLVKFQP